MDSIVGPNAMTLSSVAERVKGITQPSGTNFHERREGIRLVLGVMDLDHALREDAPTTPTAGDDAAANAAAMKQGVIPDSKDDVPFNAKQYLALVEEQFKSSSKAQASALIMRMATVMYNGAGSVREHIMMMVDIAAKMKGTEMEISDGELISLCVQEEERVRADRKDHTNLVNHDRRGELKDKKKLNFKPKKAEFKKSKSESTDAAGSSKGAKCRFCKKHGHIQKDCEGFKNWLSKKGIPYRAEAGQGRAQN
ncbi:hypothetical protein U9M48_030412 [Paspalum notatum var. saurae]|uniref:CCHC-type domain-containing protein n=1 Tax=Paspalum notatum var. saurae TaxID=547442 RepID=A0AAQ3U304_PASNO